MSSTLPNKTFSIFLLGPLFATPFRNIAITSITGNLRGPPVAKKKLPNATTTQKLAGLHNKVRLFFGHQMSLND